MSEEAENVSVEKPIVIGEGEASVREGVSHIVSNRDEMESTEFQRQLEHVEKTCFGWLDETDDECMKHCRLTGACGEARNEKLQKYARVAEKKDAKARKFQEMDGKMDEIKVLRGQVNKNFDKWANR